MAGMLLANRYNFKPPGPKALKAHFERYTCGH
jgi:hypothetical protein